MKVAKNDMVHQYKVMDIASRREQKFSEDKIVSDDAEVFARSASSSGPRGAAADVAVR